MKKSLVLALVAVLVLSFASMAFAFTDTDSHWAKTYVNKLVDLKIVNGVSTDKFSPDGKVTRAEFAKMLVNAKGIALENPAKATFKDVDAKAWFYPYVEAAAKAKLVDGVGTGNFDPNALVTREQVAKMIVLAAGKTADTTKAINFDDASAISDWAKGYVAVAADLKLVQGFNNKFNPKSNATRAEAAKLTYSEMVYEGKIVEEVVIGTDQVTDFKLDTTNLKYPLVNITIGGKRFTVDSQVTITLNGKYVNGYAVRKNTHVKFTANKDGDTVKTLDLSSSDYTTQTAKVEALGQAGASKYAVLAGSTTKIFYDTTSDSYAMNGLDTNDNPILTSATPTVAAGKGEPQVGTSYVVITDENGKAYYWLADNSNDIKGTVDFVGKDTKVYISINGTKYHADQTDVNTFVTGSTGATWASLAGKYVKFSISGDYIDGSTVVVNNMYSGYVAEKPICVTTGTIGNASAYYDVYVKIVMEATSNKYDAGSAIWIHYGNGNDFIKDTDVPDHAVKYTVAQFAYSTLGGQYIAALAANTPTNPTVLKFDTNSYSSIYVDGSLKDLTKVVKRGYARLSYKDSGILNAADFYAAKVLGRVEKITKDSSNNVTKVTISGKEYSYVGPTSQDANTDKGYLWVAKQTADPVTKNRFVEVATDDIVDGVINGDGKLATLITDYTNVINNATVVALGGQKSVMSKGTTDADSIYVPANSVEVQYTKNGLSTVTWLTNDWLDNGYKSSDANNKTFDSEEVQNTGILKGNAGYSFDSFKVGDVVDFTTFDAVVPSETINGAVYNYLQTAGAGSKFYFIPNGTGSYTSSAVIPAFEDGADHGYTYRFAAYGTADATTVQSGKAANAFVRSYLAQFIVVR